MKGKGQPVVIDWASKNIGISTAEPDVVRHPVGIRNVGAQVVGGRNTRQQCEVLNAVFRGSPGAVVDPFVGANDPFSASAVTDPNDVAVVDVPLKGAAGDGFQMTQEVVGISQGGGRSRFDPRLSVVLVGWSVVMSSRMWASRAWPCSGVRPRTPSSSNSQ